MDDGMIDPNAMAHEVWELPYVKPRMCLLTFVFLCIGGRRNRVTTWEDNTTFVAWRAMLYTGSMQRQVRRV